MCICVQQNYLFQSRDWQIILKLLKVFSRDSDLTTNVVRPSVSPSPKPQNIIKSSKSTFNSDWLSTQIDFQLRSTFNSDQHSTQINFQLRSTFNSDRHSTEIDNQHDYFFNFPTLARLSRLIRLSVLFT